MPRGLVEPHGRSRDVDRRQELRLLRVRDVEPVEVVADSARLAVDGLGVARQHQVARDDQAREVMAETALARVRLLSWERSATRSLAVIREAYARIPLRSA